MAGNKIAVEGTYQILANRKKKRKKWQNTIA